MKEKGTSSEIVPLQTSLPVEAAADTEVEPPPPEDTSFI